MQKIPASVFLVTLNEGRHLAEVLAPLHVFAEVIVVDSGSTDDTVAIATAAGARVVHQDWLGFAKQKNFAMGLCQQPWVLNLDGDEVLTDDVIASIRQLVTQAEPAALRLYFEDLFWGRPMARLSGKRSIVRLFQQGQAQYPLDRKVHENVVLANGVRELKARGLVKHYGYDSTELLMTKKNKYSSLKALEKFEKGKRASWLKLLLVFPLTFVKAYFFQKFCLSGKRGLVHAYIEAMYAFLKEAKLFELTERASSNKDSPSV